MATNYIQDGAILDLVAPYARASGEPAMIGNIFGIAINDVASGAVGQFATEGVWIVPKTSALAISAGDRLFWDSTNKVVNKTATAQICVGIAVDAAANPSDTVKMKIVPSTPAGT